MPPPSRCWRRGVALPLIKLHTELPPDFRGLASHANRAVTAKRAADLRDQCEKIAPQIKGVPDLLAKLQALPVFGGDARVDRDAVIWRVPRLGGTSLVFKRYVVTQGDWLQGKADAATVKAAGAQCVTVLTALRDLLALHDDFSMNASMDKLQAIHPVNPCFEQALKGNAENGYCRSYIYELFNDYYLKQLALYVAWVDERVAGSGQSKPAAVADTSGDRRFRQAVARDGTAGLR